MDKERLLHSIVSALHERFESNREMSRRTRAEGNDEQSRSEGKYDTRSIEENYLADGLARQAQEAATALEAFENFPTRSFAHIDPIDLGAVVEVGFEAGSEWFFLGPAGGGIEVDCEGKRITVVTLESPLGAALIGKIEGERIRKPAALIATVI